MIRDMAASLPWEAPLRRRIGQVLLGGPQTIEEVANRLGRADHRNVARAIGRLAELEVIDVAQGTARGRLVSLRAGEERAIHRTAAKRPAENATDLGRLVAGQTVVEVDVTPDLMGTFVRVMRRHESAALPLWAARVDGRADAFVLVFEGEGPHADALGAALAAAGLAVRPWTVTAVMAPTALADRLAAVRASVDAVRRDRNETG